MIIEVYVIAEWVCDAALLAMTGKLAGHRIQRYRLAAAALLGVFYGVAAYLYPVAAFIPFRLFCALCMVCAAYGYKQLVRTSLLFCTICCVYGGIGLCLWQRQVGVISLAVLYVGVSALLLAAYAKMRDSAARCSRQVDIRCQVGQVDVRARALVDSGLTARDPLTALPVVVLAASAAGELAGREADRLLAVTTLAGVTQLPAYRAKLAMQPDTSCDVMLAVAPDEFTSGQSLVPPVVLPWLRQSIKEESLWAG